MKVNNHDSYATWIILLTLLTGCEVGPSYKRPEIQTPDLDAKEEVAEYICDKWWRVFSDSTLNKLEEQALEHNADLKQAIENVEIAREIAGIALADLLPTVGVSGAGNSTFVSQRGKSYVPSPAAKRTVTGYSGSAGLSYEIDFFGKYRRAHEATRANLLSTRAAKESVLLTVTAEVAKAYFQLRALDAKLAIANRTLKTRQKTCEVYKSRFKNGYCTEFDYLRVQSEMSSVKTTVLDLESAIARIENALSMLVGTSPSEMIVRKTAKDQAIEKLRIPSQVPNGIPSDILARRPDILMAEGQLMAANARIGEARAAHYPSISLTGIFGFESKSLATLFNTGSDMWNFNSGISLPIFSGGKIKAANKIAEANYRKMLIAYEGSIKTAFRETLDALVANRKNREMVISRTRQVNSLKKSYDIAKKQKDSGLIGLLDLLDVERGLLSAEMELVSALQNQLNAVVDLCKALGGGWNASKLNKNHT
ncbi:MAG: efflux transporter outer membrane subunit [Holosporaceae bacterium]|jgi:multidrug efflux system outer membrane protein|nr:efflux transporter outer membrane subunit [Holosporaceae bacterium]